jgi:CRP-like cAMP-binding protein
MSVRADAESLRLIPIFRDSDPVALQVMAFAAERQNFLPGEMIIGHGKKAKSAFFIMSGTASVLDRDNQQIGRAEPGALLGEMAMISGALYAVSAVADTSVTTARIETSLFLRVADEYPEFGRSVLAALSRKLDQSVKEFDAIRSMLVRAKSFSDL